MTIQDLEESQTRVKTWTEIYSVPQGELEQMDLEAEMQEEEDELDYAD